MTEITMDGISQHLEEVNEYLTSMNVKLAELRVSALIRNRKALKELDAISEQVQAAMNKVNNIRTLSHPDNWRSTAASNGVQVPDKQET